MTTTTVYVVYAVSRSEHCHADIERRRLLGWLHIDGFYLCSAQKGADKTELKTAEPSK